MEENSFQNTPAYEGSVGNIAGYYSRRISIQHRLVYQVKHKSVLVDGMEYEGTVKVVRMWTHYDREINGAAAGNGYPKLD